MSHPSHLLATSEKRSTEEWQKLNEGKCTACNIPYKIITCIYTCMSLPCYWGLTHTEGSACSRSILSTLHNLEKQKETKWSLKWNSSFGEKENPPVELLQILICHVCVPQISKQAIPTQMSNTFKRSVRVCLHNDQMIPSRVVIQTLAPQNNYRPAWNSKVKLQVQ